MVWIFLDKPSGIRSIQAMNIVKKSKQLKKVGTLGILDEMASGLLPLAVGETTKEIEQMHDECLKEYDFTIKWGESTETGDCLGKILSTMEDFSDKVTLEKINNILRNFIGEIDQRPHKFSNIKVNGTRSHILARSQAQYELPSRKVFIKSLELLQHGEEYTTFKAVVGKGTYIRSLSEDIGQTLGVPCHLIYLRRTCLYIKEKNIYPQVDLLYFSNKLK